jgi:regulator of cell morphogenesis and NO signaling
MAQPPPPSSDVPVAPDGMSGPWQHLDALTRHIVATHHRYVREAAPAIAAALDRLVERHGAEHPSLAALRSLFTELEADLLAHMLKEEHLLFPYIDELAAAHRDGTQPPASPFGTILNPVRVMVADHGRSLDLAERLRAVTHGHIAPADASDDYRSCCAQLALFDEDLRRHVQLENDELFPRAVDLENRLR